MGTVALAQQFSYLSTGLIQTDFKFLMRMCTSNNFPGGIVAAGLVTKLWEELPQGPEIELVPWNSLRRWSKLSKAIPEYDATPFPPAGRYQRKNDEAPRWDWERLKSILLVPWWLPERLIYSQLDLMRGCQNRSATWAYYQVPSLHWKRSLWSSLS